MLCKGGGIYVNHLQWVGWGRYILAGGTHMASVFVKFEIEQAIESARSGEDGDLGALLEHFRPLLLRTARQRMGPSVRVRYSGSDVVQETLLSATRNFQAFRGDSARQLQGWLLRILQTRITDGLRRHCNAERRRFCGVRSDSLRGYSDGSETPSKMARLNEQSAALLSAIATLEESDRQLLALRYVEQATFEAIAALLDVPLSTLWRRWRRAIEQLKARLEDEGF
jgi:RNA polymerase sigma-70 factor, ECF subfamily